MTDKLLAVRDRSKERHFFLCACVVAAPVDARVGSTNAARTNSIFARIPLCASESPHTEPTRLLLSDSSARCHRTLEHISQPLPSILRQRRAVSFVARPRNTSVFVGLASRSRTRVARRLSVQGCEMRSRLVVRCLHVPACARRQRVHPVFAAVLRRPCRANKRLCRAPARACAQARASV